MSALIPLAEALGPVLASLTPLKPITVPLAEALGKVLAEDVRAPWALPRQPEALRQGFAVASRATIGASAQSPIMLVTAPSAVAIGHPLPAGCDAVVPEDTITPIGKAFAISQEAAPGEAVRLVGHDIAAGSLIAGRGAIVTAERRLVLQSAGIEAVNVIEPFLMLDADGPLARSWLETVLAALGCRFSLSGNADIAIAWAASGEPVLALQPGATASIGRRADGTVSIALPYRFDGMVAAFMALVLPVIAILSHRRIHLDTKPLTHKIVSTIGTTDCVLLKTTEQGFKPLSSGEITLAALAACDAVALIPPESEGMPAGQPIAATPLNTMLEEQTTP